MDARKIILLVGALFVAAITAFMARNLMVGSAAPVAGAVPVAGAPQSTNEILVATRALPVGTILDPAAMKWVPWPKDLIEGAYYQKEQTNPQSLQGTVVRFAIPAGQPLTQGALVKPGDRGFLAAALGPGMRAVTFPVDAKSSVAGFVFPGDRVDLILTQEVPGGGDGPPLKASETVLRNVRILATDQRTDQQHDEKGNTVVTTYGTVTVEATPKIAEQLAVAQTLGSLSLSLRSIADNQGELEDAIATGAVNVPTKGGAKAEADMMASVANHPSEGSSSVSTGADVSRFQRRTVPSKPPVDKGNNGASAAPTTTYPGGVAPVAQGPTVKVVRGSDATVVPVGGKN
jgi:pilus assembly protein CpaB